MSDKNEKELIEEQESGADRVGRCLKEAREARGLSRADVSCELRLAEKLIAALEDNRCADLPPPTFVSGYLRSYGRLLGLDSEALVADYRPQTDSPPPLVTKAGRSQVHSGALPVKLVTYVIILGLVALLVLWWMSRQPLEESAAPTASLGAGESVDLALPPVVVDDTEAQAEASVASADAAATNESATVIEEQPPEAEKDISSTEPGVVAVAVDPNRPLAEVTATIAEDSWMEIYGSDDERLIYGLYTAGRSVSVKGSAPFRVFLGFAPGVQMELNGEAVDVMRHKRVSNDTARFRLGSEDDNLPPR